MALKKSELYSSLWSSCDELRGGMDASQYKDYVLVLLFVKYISDRYAGQPYAPIQVPAGASFADMVALKGSAEIGDLINKKILGPLAQANGLSDMPDFNDSTKLGDGKEKVERLTNLIAIFENPALDFSKNRADGDDLLGDAYEYLMRHFATESGKSKGQFYTPAEVSRVIAQVLGIRHANTTNNTSVYDPTCGSGSLLLKVGDEARHHRDVKVSLFGQEKDNATAGLARMNMVLHDYATADIKQGNTLANPLYTNGDSLQTFDYVVANPPFSDKRWSTGLDAENDPWQRFQPYGVPPGKQGDYAYLLHILRSLKPNGRGACILPHGVLFRGNVEAAIRRNLVQRGYIKGIIGLPPNLFYGTGIPACIIVLDKEGANARKGIFMIDASKAFIKDGNKNRLREQDIHKIVDTFARQVDVPRYARLVAVAEISDQKNDYNLNYDSFGNVIGSSPTRYTYTGREFDADTGLFDYRARFYESQQGRFVSEDPIGFEGGNNFYVYVENNPLNFVDPDGLKPDFYYCFTRCAANQLGIRTVVGAAGVGAGLPLVKKDRPGFPGASPRTSFASKYLSSRFQQRIPRAWAPTARRPLAMTNKLGRFAGRWIPWIGWGLLAYDAIKIGICVNDCQKSDCP